jgi:hypothetical protein
MTFNTPNLKQDILAIPTTTFDKVFKPGDMLRLNRNGSFWNKQHLNKDYKIRYKFINCGVLIKKDSIVTIIDILPVKKRFVCLYNGQILLSSKSAYRYHNDFELVKNDSRET